MTIFEKVNATFAAAMGAVLIAALLFTSAPRTEDLYSLEAAVIVEVFTVGENSTKAGHGSGVHIGDGLVLTAGHVVNEFMRYEVDGNAAVILLDDDRRDVAVLRVDALKGTAAVIIGTNDPLRGTEVFSTGNPAHRAGTFNDLSVFGVVAGEIMSWAHWAKVIPVNMSGAPGISGAPVFLQGTNVLVGIFVGGPLPYGSVGVIVPVSVILEAMEELE